MAFLIEKIMSKVSKCIHKLQDLRCFVLLNFLTNTKRNTNKHMWWRHIVLIEIPNFNSKFCNHYWICSVKDSIKLKYIIVLIIFDDLIEGRCINKVKIVNHQKSIHKNKMPFCITQLGMPKIRNHSVTIFAVFVTKFLLFLELFLECSVKRVISLWNEEKVLLA